MELVLKLNMFVALLIGEVISEKDRCSTCRGKKVVNETKILEVHIDKGMKEGQKIYFRGEGDQQVSVTEINSVPNCILFPHHFYSSACYGELHKLGHISLFCFTPLNRCKF